MSFYRLLVVQWSPSVTDAVLPYIIAEGWLPLADFDKGTSKRMSTIQSIDSQYVP